MKAITLYRSSSSKSEASVSWRVNPIVLRLLALLILLIGSLPSLSAGDTTWLSNAKYGIFIHYLPGINSYWPNGNDGTYSNLASVPQGGTNSAWDNNVWSFNVPAFVQQAVDMGVGYVVFSVGQSSGYYCSPNNNYQTYTGTSVGEFTSHRDLIAELGPALGAKGIYLMVYLASEGPQGAFPLRRWDSSVCYPAQNIHAANPNGAAYETYFRERFNNVVTEWSTRWTGKVAGWWLDGCFLGSGYRDKSDNNNGLANLNALIAACKSGNPNAIVAANPQLEFSGLEYTALTTNQDFTAGEDCIFRRYPDSRFINYNGVNMQWHTLSYLGRNLLNGNNQEMWGTGWGKATTSRYTDEQLIKYVKFVSDNGGAVTIDVAIAPNGSIHAPHYNQMVEVKKVIRNGGAGPTSENAADQALFKPVRIMDNSGSGTTELPTNSYDKYSVNPVGADYNRYTSNGSYACAANAWAWNLRTDLRGTATIRRINIGFSPVYYATQFAIDYSTNGTAWTTWATATATQATAARTTGGTTLYGNGTGRYWRVRAIKPDNSGQAGIQMGVRYFQMYLN
jgi:hypothetical protein